MWHIKHLCDSPMNGGGGFTPQEVGDMALDQIWMCLCDMEMMKAKADPYHSSKSGAASPVPVDANGMMKGRDEHGNPIKGRFRGKSKARQLMEEAQQRRSDEAKVNAKGKRR